MHSNNKIAKLTSNDNRKLEEKKTSSDECKHIEYVLRRKMNKGKGVFFLCAGVYLLLLLLSLLLSARHSHSEMKYVCSNFHIVWENERACVRARNRNAKPAFEMSIPSSVRVCVCAFFIIREGGKKSLAEILRFQHHHHWKFITSNMYINWQQQQQPSKSQCAI